MITSMKPIPPLSETSAKNIRRLLLKKHRDQSGKYLIEGARLVADAIDRQATIETIVLTERYWLKNEKTVESLRRLNCFIAKEKTFDRLSDTQTNQGILAIVNQRKIEEPEFTPAFCNENPILLALDTISDPGNAGTIFRTADWFGVKTVVMNTGCVEAHNPKVVRATMGSIFDLNIYEGADLIGILPKIKECGYVVVGTSGEGSTDFAPLKGKSVALMIGSEVAGLSHALISHADHVVTVPKKGRGESLNAAVAAGILLSKLTE